MSGDGSVTVRKIAPQVELVSSSSISMSMSTSLRSSRRGAMLSLATVPSAAFGDGSHPTTRLCTQAVDLLCRTRAPRALLDVGTGSGVLARVARARGVPLVVGTDIDPAALENARDNAARDEALALDATAELCFEATAPDAWGARFDVVVANILEGVLLALAAPISRALAPGGALLLSGFLPAQSPSLRASYAAHGLTPVLEAHLDGWALLQLEAPALTGA